MIDSLTIQKIKDSADIVEVVSDYVHLIRRGANYMGLCPFHNERTPSFSVNKRKNFCYCFSCKKGGSPVNFVMQKEGLSYHDALLHLAHKYGIEVEERELTDEERQAQSEREGMLVANEWAMIKMEKDLLETQDGKDIGLTYLFQRGVTMEAIKRFHLGYALDKSDALCKAATKAGYDLGVFKQLGLVGESSQHKEYDRFRGRVIFPIINSAGKVIAFGGRDLKGGLAKYINSPESSLYKKSDELYGIFQARADIVKEDKCFLVEGYLDVIGMWQAGMRNTVASSGTALTDGQIALIHRFTENITLIYDGDAAGIKAALRGIDMLLNHNMTVKVLLLPDGDDPDSFAKKHTSEEFQKYVQDHETDIIRFKANVLLNDIKGGDPQKRIAAIQSVVQSIAHINDQISRDVYIQECSSILGVADTTIAKSVAVKRAGLVEQWKRDRARKALGSDNNSGIHINSGTQYSGSVSASDSGLDSTADIPSSGINMNNAAEKKVSEPQGLGNNNDFAVVSLEKNVLQYCIKYGYMEICSYVDDGGENCSLDVIDYVAEELYADNLTFSVPVYKQIFNILKDMKRNFADKLDEYRKNVESESKKMQEDGIHKIAEISDSMAEIEHAEKKLQNEIEKQALSKIRDFCRDYPGKQLASHEDDDVRQVSISLMQEEYQLSAIYSRDNNVIETEEDKLDMLVPRALTEWRNEILNDKLKSLFLELNSISGKGEVENEIRIQEEMKRLMAMRSKVAKEIGERIISPNRSSNYTNK